MRDIDPELFEARVIAAQVGELKAMTVAEFLETIEVFRVQVQDIASDQYLTPVVGMSRITLDLNAVLEQAAKSLACGDRHA